MTNHNNNNYYMVIEKCNCGISSIGLGYVVTVLEVYESTGGGTVICGKCGRHHRNVSIARVEYRGRIIKWPFTWLLKQPEIEEDNGDPKQLPFKD